VSDAPTYSSYEVTAIGGGKSITRITCISIDTAINEFARLVNNKNTVAVLLKAFADKEWHIIARHRKGHHNG